MASAAKSIEQTWQEVGRGYWEDTYHRGMGDEEVVSALWSVIKDPVPDDVRGTIHPRVMVAAMFADAVWSAKWVDGACRTLLADEKYAAALACTRVNSRDAEDISIPWPAFAVRLPAGLFPISDGRWLTHVRCFQLSNPTGRVRSGVLFNANGHALPVAIETEHDTLADALFDEDDIVDEIGETDGAWLDRDALNRAMAMSKRCVVGMLYAMQHTANWSPHGRASVKSKRLAERAAPDHRTIYIGRPIGVDMRQAVREACLRGASAPLVQTLVRGHYKRQVIGVGRSGRKVIWVEPYWRGPEDAPILARPYKVGT